MFFSFPIGNCSIQQHKQIVIPSQFCSNWNQSIGTCAQQLEKPKSQRAEKKNNRQLQMKRSKQNATIWRKENFLSSTSNEPFRFDLFQCYDGKTRWLFVTNSEQKHSHVYCLLINNVMNINLVCNMSYANFILKRRRQVPIIRIIFDI